MIKQSITNLVPTAKAAEILQVKPNTLNIWRANGRKDLPFVRVGRLVRYRLEDIEAFIKKNSVGYEAE
jgi:excisionase family DNA binding protein